MGSEFIWFWIAIEQNNKEILGFSLLKVVVAERFLSNFRRDMANIQVQEVDRNQYPQACIPFVFPFLAVFPCNYDVEYT